MKVIDKPNNIFSNAFKVGDFTVEVQKEIRVEFDEMTQIVDKQIQIVDSRANDKLNMQGLYLSQ
jgi:hypothetical protein